MTNASLTATILLVEDNEDHAILIKKVLQGSGIIHDIRVATTGEMALDYLHHTGEFLDPDNAPRPELILLDVQLPGINGIGVLKAIKQDPQLKLIPVIMLTTSTQQPGGVDNTIIKSQVYKIKGTQHEQPCDEVVPLRFSPPRRVTLRFYCYRAGK